LDRTEFRNAARDALQRHIGEKAPEPEPTRPDRHPGEGRGWLGQGDMVSENKAGNLRHRQVNQKVFEHQRQTAAALDQRLSPPASTPEREDRRQQFKAAALEVTGREDGPPRPPSAERAPDTGPGRPPPATAAAKSREALNEHIERTQSPARNDMRQAARETLQRHIESPERRDIPTPGHDLNRPRGFER
jgi:hypothetical protein